MSSLILISVYGKPGICEGENVPEETGGELLTELNRSYTVSFFACLSGLEAIITTFSQLSNITVFAMQYRYSSYTGQ